MSLRPGKFGIRQRIVGAVTCYAALLALAGSGIAAAMAVIGIGVGVLVADWRLAGPVQDAEQVATAPRWPLATTALLVMPVAANVLIVAVVVAGDSSLEALPLEASAGVVMLAALAAGLTAVRHDAPAESHGWWALGGGGVALVLFGVLAALFAG